MSASGSESRRRLEREILSLRQRLESAEDMQRAISRAEIDGFVTFNSESEESVVLLSPAARTYQQLFERMREGAVTLTRAGEILHANERFAATVAVPLPQLFSAPLQHYVLPSDRAQFEAWLAAGAIDSILEAGLRGEDDSVRRVRLTLAARADNHIALLVSDLTDHDRLEEAIAAMEALRRGQVDGIVVADEQVMLLGEAQVAYRLAAEHVRRGIVTVCSQRLILHANEYFARLAGVAGESLGGRLLDEFFVEDERAELAALIRRAANLPAENEFSLLRASAGPLPVLVSAQALETPGVVALVIADLTEQREQEKLREVARRKDEFIAVLGHELRNPLASIINGIEILGRSQQPLEPHSRYAVQLISRQTSTLIRLVDDLLDVNRLNQNKVQLQSARLDLSQVIADAVDSARPFIEAKEHALEIDAPRGTVWIEGDHVRLSQVVLNLLTNAAKYTQNGGRIKIELRRDVNAAGKTRALIRVIDSGIGIDGAHLPKIFEPFTQVSHPGERLGTGLGLGLAICKRLVELHGGSISACSAGRLQGSEFLVELPERGAAS